MSIDFALTDEQKMMQQLARDFARSEIAPVAEHYDRTGEFPIPVIEKARAAGATVKLIVRHGKKHGWLTMWFDIRLFADWFDAQLKARRPVRRPD